MTDKNSLISEVNNSPRGEIRVADLDDYQDELIGACIYLSPEELRLLGVSTEAASNIAYRIDPDQQSIDIWGTPAESESEE